MKTVYVLATLDTKGIEAAFVRDQLAALKVPTKIVDTGCMGSPAVQADIGREEVFHLAGTSLAASSSSSVSEPSTRSTSTPYGTATGRLTAMCGSGRW